MSGYDEAGSRRRIGLKAPITGLVLICLVAFASYWGWQRAFGDSAAVSVETDGCATVTPTPPPLATTTAATTAPSTSPPTVVAVDAHFVAATTTTTTPAVSPSATPTPTGPAVLEPVDVDVNVYNATARPGLAANTAAVLRDRGFTVLDVNNAPADDLVTSVAEIRAATAASPQVLLLVQHVPGAVIVPDGRADASIDLVLGDAFTSLGDPALVTPVPLPSRSC